jgi:hypothetical protein
MDETSHDPNGSHDAATGSNGHGAGATPDETLGWGDEATGGGAGADPRATAERMLGQLQSRIDQVATQAAPVVRQIGAKAAELAAVAADRAGPLAHRAAEATADASVKLAERSRTLAADLRSRNASESEADGAGDQSTAQPDVDQGGIAVAEIDGADDPDEEAARDDPAEGSR